MLFMYEIFYAQKIENHKYFDKLKSIFKFEYQIGGAMAQQNPAKKATLIEVLMVILIVGIIVILVFPTIGEKRNKDRMNLEVFPTFDIILQANEQFNEEQGYYAFDITMLNLTDVLEDKQYFEFALTDTTVIAITTPKFGKAGAKIVYNFAKDYWTVEGTEDVIDKSWLP